MRRNISQNSSLMKDLSNNSMTQIVMQTSGRYQCGICKSSNQFEELVQVCKCQEQVHEKCMKQLIDDWIEQQSIKTKQENSQNQNPFKCSLCQSEVFYKMKNQFICRNLTGICIEVKKHPLKSFFQTIFFLLGIGGLILSVLIKSEKVFFSTGLNHLTISIIAIASIIVSSFMASLSFYFIIVDIFTQKRKRVDVLYQKSKKGRRRISQTIPVVSIS